MSTPHKRHLEDPSPRYDRDSKRSRPSPPLRSSVDDEHLRRRSPARGFSRSPRPSINRDPWDPQAGDVSDHDHPPSSRNTHNRSYSPRDDRSLLVYSTAR